MVSVDCFEIEGKKYMITNQAKDNNIVYYFLSNLEDNEDMMIKKAKENDLSMLYPLDNDGEVIHAIRLLERE